MDGVDMRLSEKRKDEAYKAIADTVMDLRIDINQNGTGNIDTKLFILTNEIWRRVHKALNLNSPA